MGGGGGGHGEGEARRDIGKSTDYLLIFDRD